MALTWLVNNLENKHIQFLKLIIVKNTSTDNARNPKASTHIQSEFIPFQIQDEINGRLLKLDVKEINVAERLFPTNIYFD
jgi:hypothetical protein